MSLLQLRAHRDHTFGEYYNECGYCWLEGEANAGEYQGGGYDSYNMTQDEVHASHAAALAPRDMRRTDRRYLAMDDLSRHMYDLGRSHHVEGVVAGTGGEYAEEPAYSNPFSLTGAIGGFLPDRERDYYHARRFMMDALIGASVHTPVNLIIISGVT